jgi:hypothetical protein
VPRCTIQLSHVEGLLESIVRGLKTEPPQNDADWQAQTELVQACLAEMVEMSEPTVNPSIGATSRPDDLSAAVWMECASLVRPIQYQMRPLFAWITNPSHDWMPTCSVGD